jgi:hypothetical protein
MITNGFRSRSMAIGALIQFLKRGKWVFGLAIAALLATAATSPPPLSDENTDQEYIRIMNLMDRADALRATGKADAAKAKDQEAYKALLTFQRTHPKWNSKSVEYRLNQLAQEIEGRPKESETSSKPKGHTNLEAPSKHSSTESTSSAAAAVKLLDPGAEPHKALRLHVKAGDKQTVIISVKVNMSMDMPGAPGAGNAAPNIPALSLPADVSVQSVAANGDITYQMVFEEPGVAEETNTIPQVAQAMKTALAGFKGLTTTAVISDRGVSKKVDIKMPPDANPQVRQTVDQMKENMMSMGSLFPEEPIGTGAKWQVKMPVKSSGMTVEQTTDYQLASIDGDHLSTTFTQTQSAANQKMQNPSMGATQMNVLQMTNSMTGNIASDLSKLMPLQATMDGHTEMNAEITAAGKKQPMSMKIGMNLTMESR